MPNISSNVSPICRVTTSAFPQSPTLHLVQICPTFRIVLHLVQLVYMTEVGTEKVYIMKVFDIVSTDGDLSCFSCLLT